MLEITGLKAGYGSIIALKNISLSVEQGEIVTIIGGNGAGKTTLLKAIMGLIPALEGSVHLEGNLITHMPTQEIVSMGIAMVPEGRKIFGNLSTLENLKMGAYPRRDTEVNKELEEVISIFPILRERRKQRGGTLSGGEQQMLSIARALMSRPRILLLDEPSMGLAPLIVSLLFEFIAQIKARGYSILMVEQNVVKALKLCDRAYLLEQGTVKIEGDREAFAKEEYIRQAYLGL